MGINTEKELIVIGGGPAGVTAALRARELGANVTLVESGRMGGTCTNDGCVPTRVLAHTARLLREARQFEEYGLMGECPTLDFGYVMRRAAQVVYTIHEKKQLIRHLQDAEVQVYSEVGEARFVDPYTIALPDGRHLQAEKFILCAGGRARRLDFPGAELAYTHSDVWSLRDLPPSMIIVGAAATGCQLASIFDAFGARVAMLELAPRILNIEDQAIADAVSSAFRSRGIEIITGIEGVRAIERNGELKSVIYTAGGQEHSLSADAVLLSAGWVGNLSNLNLEAAGVETRGPYVPTNDFLQTSAEHIFAAGDINGKMMLVQSAGSEALAAAENAMLGMGQQHEHLIVPHGGFTDPEYASVGLTEAAAREQGEVVVGEASYGEIDRAVIDGHTGGICKLIVSVDNHRILGAHVAGEQALEIVHMVAAGMASDMWVEQLAELQIAYPTYTAVIGLAARSIIRQLGVVPLAPEWRSLEQRLPPDSTAGKGAQWEVRSQGS